jgi:hypothetical protein
MVFLFMFLIGFYSFLDSVLSFDFKQFTKKMICETTEGTIFEIDKTSFSILGFPLKKPKTTIRFMTSKLEWITGEPVFFANLGSKEGECISVYYNSENPNEFSTGSIWFVKNKYVFELLGAFTNLLFSIFGFYMMLETGFTDKLLDFFGI